MNCRDCKYCSNVPGSAHKECNTPLLDVVKTLIMAKYASGSGLRNPTCLVAKNKETGETLPLIDIDPQGIEGGWALWPFNFDPTWINSCLMFEGKNTPVEVEMQTEKSVHNEI